MAATKKHILEEMACTCLMSRVRLASRVVTGIYEEELRPFGIKGSQFNLLATIGYAGTVRRSDIGEVLRIDASTLTRNLRIMESNGWIEDVAESADGRGFPIRLTAKGNALLLRASSAWKVAQRRAARLLGNEGKSALMKFSGGMPDAAT